MGFHCHAQGVTKSYSGTPVLRGIDLTVAEGEFCVLVGPSGCGKSTLLRSLAGLEELDAGTVSIAGRDVTNLPPRDRDIAMVFQSYALYPHMTVRENLGFGLKLRGTPPQEITERVREVSDMLGLKDFLERLPRALSGGQRQRVAMGRAIVRRAKLYLFDEPLSNLDSALRSEVRVEIRKLHERFGWTTIYVTHDQVEAMTLSDSLWVLRGGRVEQSGPPLDIYKKPSSVFVAKFLGSPAMNVFSANRIAEGALAFGALPNGTRVPLPALADSASTSLTLGIRPHDIAIHAAGNGNGNTIPLIVDVVERLGFEVLLHGRLQGSDTPLVVRAEGQDGTRVKNGDTVGLSFDPSLVHVFDPKTEKSLTA